MMVPRVIIVLLLLWSCCCCNALSPQTLVKVRAAMALTNNINKNISKAYQACDLWSDLRGHLDDDPTVQKISLVLYASCLVRVGRDSDAICIYNECLNLLLKQDSNDKNLLEDVIIGRASALQRLMRYDEALHQFEKSSATRGTMGAVTCCLRLNQVNRAVEILLQQATTKEERAMLTVLQSLQGGSSVDLEALTAAASPLYQWLWSVFRGKKGESGDASGKKTFDLLQVAAINQSPLDDPQLWNMDDKIKLHQLLAPHETKYWPVGFVLPDELESFRRYVKDTDNVDKKDWILKSRAGYGSHGNQIVSHKEVLDNSTSDDEPRLCQRLVEPPLLLSNDGCKFSMRVYVYYFFAGDDVYLSSLGLVKLASRAYDEQQNADEDMHMTNSGRDNTMMQRDFEYLEKEFQSRGWSYEEFWNRIRDSVKETMQIYSSSAKSSDESYRNNLGRLGIPKILGLDFMATTEKQQPMLLEVNRFPGLEPRGDGDEYVKHAVVRQAWTCAAKRLGIAPTIVVDESQSVDYERL